MSEIKDVTEATVAPNQINEDKTSYMTTLFNLFMNNVGEAITNYSNDILKVQAMPDAEFLAAFKQYTDAVDKHIAEEAAKTDPA